jgi:DNA-binding NtrC family response regulator
MAAPLRILLVDDEASLLTLLKRHLERGGYSVVACLSAEQAAAAVEGTDWQPEILVTDETLPGISGTALAAGLLDRFPRLLTLLCSGYPMSMAALPPALRGRAAILPKPFLPAMLEDAIAELLGNSSGAV